MVNITSVIFKRSATGETRATNNEVLAILKVLLNQLQFTYLIFNGLNECSAPSELFRTLEAVAIRSVTSAVLFLRRPTVQLPAQIARVCFTINLKKGNPPHINNIKKALRPQLNELVKEDLFPKELDLNKTIEKITARANGIFL